MDLSSKSKLALGTIALAGAIYFCVHTIYLSLFLTRSMPIFDQVAIVFDYVRIVNGEYSAIDLFRQHNEHRIVTARPFLFADAWLFSMVGVIPGIAAYVSFAGIAWIIAAQAASEESSALNRCAVFLVLLCMFWSLINWATLSVGMQLSFALVHLFALAAIFFFSSERTPRNFVLACCADALAVYSLASGLFVIVPIIAVAVWMQRIDRYLLVIAAMHTVLAVAYFYGLRPLQSVDSSLHDAALTVLLTLGWIFVATPAQLYAGIVAFAVTVLLCAWATWRAMFARVRLGAADSLLLGVSLFVVLEAFAAGLTRPVANPRYAVLSVIVFTCLLALAWRHSAQLRRMTSAAQIAVLGLVAVSAIYANHPRHEAEWRSDAAVVDRVAAAVLRDDRSPEVIAILWPPSTPWWLDMFYRRMREQHLGPFRK